MLEERFVLCCGWLCFWEASKLPGSLLSIPICPTEWAEARQAIARPRCT